LLPIHAAPIQDLPGCLGGVQVTSCGWCLSRMLGEVSEHRRQRVDEEIKRIVGEAHDEAARLLADNRDRLAMRSPRR
jgi:ATP-dependent Zn protease